MSKTVFYGRVSTAEQTIAHQVTQARAAGFKINGEDVVHDDGVSGYKVPLAERPGGKRLFDILRAGDTLVVRWVDRLGCNYEDVSDNVREFMRRGVIVRTVINSLTFDGSTKDPMQQAVRDALIGFMAAMSQAQAEASKDAQRAGIAHAKAKAEELGFYLGRKPSFNRKDLQTIHDMLTAGASIGRIAAETKLTRQTVYRVRDDPAWAEAALAAWEAKRIGA